jgi:hypothetical protein
VIVICSLNEKIQKHKQCVVEWQIILFH